MARTLKVAAAQTGAVLSDDMRPGVVAACRMVEEAAKEQVQVICFPELFLTPSSPTA